MANVGCGPLDRLATVPTPAGRGAAYRGHVPPGHTPISSKGVESEASSLPEDSGCRAPTHEKAKRAPVRHVKAEAAAEEKTEDESIAPALKPPRCPEGHLLTAFRADWDYACNKCSAPVRQGEHLFGCRTCDYDECQACCGKIWAGQEGQARAAQTSADAAEQPSFLVGNDFGEAANRTSFGDLVNYCTVESAEQSDEDEGVLEIVASVVGMLHEASSAQLSLVMSAPSFAPAKPVFRSSGRTAGVPRAVMSHSHKCAHEVCLTFEFPVSLMTAAEDVLFSYAPGYSRVSLLKTVMKSKALVSPASSEHDSQSTGTPDGEQLPRSPKRLRWSFQPAVSTTSCPDSLPSDPETIQDSQEEEEVEVPMDLTPSQLLSLPSTLQGQRELLAYYTKQLAGSSVDSRPPLLLGPVPHLPKSIEQLQTLKPKLPAEGKEPFDFQFDFQMSKLPAEGKEAKIQSEAHDTLKPHVAAEGEEAEIQSEAHEEETTGKTTKRDDGFIPSKVVRFAASCETIEDRASSPRESGDAHLPSLDGAVDARLPSPTQQATVRPAKQASVVCGVETQHAEILVLLSKRLRETNSLQNLWKSGDAAAFAAALTSSGSEALACSFLAALLDHPKPISPQVLARLLPLAHRLGNSECEDHAVMAMRFMLHALHVSWPAICSRRRSVTTSKAVRDSCEEVSACFANVFVTVKGMAKSVKLSRSNGPLLALCRKLKSALENALVLNGKTTGARAR